MFHQAAQVDQTRSAPSTGLSLNSNASCTVNRLSIPSPPFDQQGLCSMTEIPSYVINSMKNPYILHLDRMTAKQHYECFPDYLYNSAFGSLLSGPTCPNQLELQRNACRSTSEPWDHCASQQQEVVQQNGCETRTSPIRCQNALTRRLLPNVIEFLNDFIPYLSCIAQSQSYTCSNEPKKLLDVIEQLHQLRVALGEQISPCRNSTLPMAAIDYSTMSTVLQHIRCLIDYLTNPEQCTTMRAIPLHLQRFDHFVQRLQALIAMHSQGQVDPTILSWSRLTLLNTRTE